MPFGDLKRDVVVVGDVVAGVVHMVRALAAAVAQAVEDQDWDAVRQFAKDAHDEAPALAKAVVANTSVGVTPQGGVDVDQAGAQAITDANLALGGGTGVERREGAADTREQAAERRDSTAEQA